MQVLQAEHLKKYYGETPNVTRAVEDVSFSAGNGEFVAIVISIPFASLRHKT